MPKKKIVDLDKLLKAIESEVPAKEIMSKFDIKTSGQLKALYLDALVARGQAAAIPGRSGKAADAAREDITVNKRGSLIVPKEVVTEMGFKVGDLFSVRRTKAGVSLKKL